MIWLLEKSLRSIAQWQKRMKHSAEIREVEQFGIVLPAELKAVAAMDGRRYNWNYVKDIIKQLN